MGHPRPTAPLPRLLIDGTLTAASDGRYTVDHLFADIWLRPGLSDRDRRLLLIGVLAGSGPLTCSTSRCRPRTPTASSTTTSSARS